jgi:hypothetical protein
MPKVGKGQKAVNYPYSDKGIKDAMAHAKRTGETVEMEGGGMMPKYGHGGMVNPMMPMRPMYKHGGAVPKYPGGGMVRPMRPMYKHGGSVMSPMQKMAMRNRLAKIMMEGGKVHSKKKKK